jgi:pimeloyl-ACP methyl ester carboxylesterase
MIYGDVMFSKIFQIFAVTLLAVSPSHATDKNPDCKQDIIGQKAAVIKDFKRFTVALVGDHNANVRDVVLVPGLATPRDVWTQAIAAQSKCYRFHVIQIRGFGDDAGANAEGPVLKPFVDELAIYMETLSKNRDEEKPMLVGHSLGGLSALMIGAHYPDLSERLMVVDALPFIGTMFNPAANVDTVKPQAEQMAAFIRAGYGRPKAENTGVDPGPRSQAGTMSNHAAGRIAIDKWTKNSDARVVAQALYDDMLIDMRPELNKIKAPLTLLYAQDDSGMTKEQSTAFFVPHYSGAPNFRAVQITGSYHFIMLDQPEKFAKELADFLGEITERSE